MNTQGIRLSINWLPATLILIIISGCAPLTIQEQKELGDEASSTIEESVTLHYDSDLEQYINALADILIEQPPITGHDFTFHVITSDGFNAFAIAGGNIYLTTGLIKNCRNVSELVSIMGHEIAHVKLGHIDESYRPNKVSKTIADLTGITLAIVTANPFLVATGDIAANLGSSVFITNHSRESEREADELAFEMMLSTGYDVRSQLTIFSRLKIARSANGVQEGQLPFLMTHPLPEERVESARTRIEQLQRYRPEIISDNGQLEAIQIKLP